MFETDMEYLRATEEMFKKRGIKIDNKDIILKNRHKTLKLLYILSIGTSIIYAFFIGFVFGGG